MTTSPVRESSEPVGSSAKSTSGWATRPGQWRRAGLGRPTAPLTAAPLGLQAEAVEPRPRLAEGLRAVHPVQEQWEGDVLLGRQFGHELAELEDETEAIAAQRAALLLAQVVDPLPANDLARSGTRMPARQWSRVDLPEPLGPITARISPRATDTLAPRRAGVSPKDRTASRLDDGGRRRRCGTGGAHDRTASARTLRRAAVRSIQRRSASRWNRP